MIDNFDQISKHLNFTLGDFYFLQIIKRRKDNPGLEKSEKIIDNFYIYSLEQFEKFKPKIIEICKNNNARAYFRLNKRNSEKIALQCLKKITDLVICEDYAAVKSVYPSVCGSFHHDEVKKWILDFDTQNIGDSWRDFIKIRDEFNKNHPNSKIEFLGTIPTKNGYHIICMPFDISYFWDTWDKLKLDKSYLPDIHKDNPTILYIP